MAIENLDGIDVADGLKRVAGNRPFYRNLLLKFRQSQAAAPEIRQALAAGDRQRAERIAHTVKGIAGSIGAKELQAAAATVEQDFGTRTQRTLRLIFRPLKLRCAVLLPPSQTSASSNREPLLQPIPDLSKLLPKLSELELLLKNDDFDARNILEELLPHFQNPACRAL